MQLRGREEENLKSQTDGDKEEREGGEESEITYVGDIIKEPRR